LVAAKETDQEKGVSVGHRFTDRVVLVTGGSSGIGKAIVDLFAAEGARVVAAARRQSLLDEVADELRGRGLELETLSVDVRSPTEVKAMVEKTIELFGRLDVLVNCAGIGLLDPVLEITEEGWNDTMATNLHGAFFASQSAARHMAEQGGGAIINLASIDAFIAESPAVHYCASKAAMVMMTKCFAYELGHLGIRCNATAPGVTMTPMILDDPDLKRMAGPYLGRIPARRFSSPDEQARVVAFLASDDASYVNGETIVVDGGQLKGFWYYADDAPPVPDAARRQTPS
jgi:NAD(P)-dependent dehydrogenase (short-subunit alcohol dehydrogenase family)